MANNLLFLIISFGASVVGAICGIGGGVIIKPVLDFFRVADVATISFLSGCTVLSMSCYSVVKNLSTGESRVNMKTGILGKQLFSSVKAAFASPNTVGAIQAACLAALTVGTLIYTINKNRIRTKQVSNLIACLIIGLALGILSSFLGIGGGPFNLVILFFFFSMDTKTAAQNSLYIILFSQVTSLLTTLLTHSVPDFQWIALILMISGGILGGIVGRKANKKMDEKAVDKLFIILMCIIILISIYNTYRYSH